MSLAFAQVAQQHSAFGTLLLLIGVVALLFVFRRSIVLRIRQRRSGVTAPRRSGPEAGRLIRRIEENWWIERNRRAMVFKRGALSISAEQAAFLDEVTAGQARRRQGWKDGED